MMVAVVDMVPTIVVVPVVMMVDMANMMAKMVVSVSVGFRSLTLRKHGFFLCLICLRYRQPLPLPGCAYEPL